MPKCDTDSNSCFKIQILLSESEQEKSSEISVDDQYLASRILSHQPFDDFCSDSEDMVSEVQNRYLTESTNKFQMPSVVQPIFTSVPFPVLSTNGFGPHSKLTDTLRTMATLRQKLPYESEIQGFKNLNPDSVSQVILEDMHRENCLVGPKSLKLNRFKASPIFKVTKCAKRFK